MFLWGQGGSQVSALFYRAEIQALLLFGLESWVLSDAMIQEVEGTHVGFIRNITGKRERRQSNRTWETLAADEVLWAAGTQSVAIVLHLQPVSPRSCWTDAVPSSL